MLFPKIKVPLYSDEVGLYSVKVGFYFLQSALVFSINYIVNFEIRFFLIFLYI